MAKRAAIDVKSLRASMGMTQKQLAHKLWEGETLDDEKVQHRTRTIQRWEAGDHSPTNIAQSGLRRILKEHQDRQRAGPDGQSERPSQSPQPQPAVAAAEEQSHQPQPQHATRKRPVFPREG